MFDYEDMPDPFEDDYVKSEIARLAIPEYDNGTVKVIHKPLMGRCDDYLNVNFRIDETMVVPMMFIDGELWMSLTPMEIQSAALAIYCATGECATAGLGMGYYALSIAAKPEVTRVDVYEANQKVIDFFIEVHGHKPECLKIRIIHGDVRETMWDKEYDHFFADVYQTLGSWDALNDILLLNQLNRNVIGDYMFWGMEKAALEGVEEEIITPWRLSPVLKAYLRKWTRHDELCRMYRTQFDGVYLNEFHEYAHVTDAVYHVAEDDRPETGGRTMPT